MLVQRAFTLVVLLVGVGLGLLLPRPWSETPAAEAKSGQTWRCIFATAPGLAVVYAQTSATYTARFTNSNAISDSPVGPIELFPNEHHTHAASVAGTWVFQTSAGSILVDGTDGSGDDRRQVACYKDGK